MRNRDSWILRFLFLSPILYCALLTGSSPAQSFLFVSPNTREQMTDESAWNSLESFEQTNFLAAARYFAGKLCSKPEIWSAEGMNGSNTENSSLITGCIGGKARFLGELLGRYAHQKWILVFDPDRKSKERLLIVTFSMDHPQDAAKELRRFGISTGTIVVQDKTTRFYLRVNDDSQDTPVHAFVAAYHGTLEEIAGRATFIGNDDRRVSQRIFDQHIRAYEQAHHLTLSNLLWSRRLRDLGGE